MTSEAPRLFKITRASKPTSQVERDALLANPGFGRLFTEHMAKVMWTEGEGWHDAVIVPREKLVLDPAAAVFHYAQEIFEGLKAYKTKSGEIVLFRPEQNALRFQRSAKRLGMPEVPVGLFITAVEELVKVDAAWTPPGSGSLYLRPFMMATEAFLGVRPSKEYLFSVIASPVAAYFGGGKETVSVWLTTNFTRAAPGGTGDVKCGGNYAAGLLAQAEAYQNECDQVLFVDSIEHRWIEELGGMNVFFVFEDGSLGTPPLSGTILPGITRDSIISLACASGLTVREERYEIDQLRSDAKNGVLKEAFACGTAAVVAAIGEVRTKTGAITIGDGRIGPVTEKIKAQLVGIQRGEEPNAHQWVRRVC